MIKIGVINASPLIFLSRGGHLDILPRFYERLLVPSAVMSEILARGAQDTTVAAVHLLQRIEVIDLIPANDTISAWGLGAGESAVLSLAASFNGAEAILDDLLGRRCASVAGIPVRGTLGIILMARQRKIIPAARPVLEDILRGGMYLDRRILDEALRRVGE